MFCMGSIGLGAERGLVARYALEEGLDGPVRDWSGTGNHGKNVGAKYVSLPEGRGFAPRFETPEAQVNWADDTSLDVTGALTTELWLYRETTIARGEVGLAPFDAAERRKGEPLFAEGHGADGGEAVFGEDVLRGPRRHHEGTEHEECARREHHGGRRRDASRAIDLRGVHERGRFVREGGSRGESVDHVPSRVLPGERGGGDADDLGLGERGGSRRTCGSGTDSQLHRGGALSGALTLEGRTS